MFKPVYKNIWLFFFVKYLVFYLILMVKNNDFTLIQLSELKTFQDVFYYLWMLLFLPVLGFILFSVPIYYAFKQKRIIYFILFIGLTLVAEYFMYTYFASQLNLVNGVYNGLLSLVFLSLFFFKHINLLVKQRE